ncbi:hypothetical protein CUV01_14845 [Paracoccus tegillarcae]|uniref:Uncharacterized protein n=1 Tax=Paracoccus tegillarcae TaxID=1529068 RepID=A0A2K9F5N3_9RHOB|nr:hypothetical protein CUV01_14845 [Paracoccus tegillarcae]
MPVFFGQYVRPPRNFREGRLRVSGWLAAGPIRFALAIAAAVQMETPQADGLRRGLSGKVC